ncbi:MAG: glycosyltransferase family 2 protein [Planctomycetes bacterium]|nr:glycosyltransferase family 2 protein [Planctomycetota bacterium]
MTDSTPHVSICLPVYNGDNYVRQAIESILAQTFEDFELIISDNASTDATGDICRAASERDNRVRYFRADENRGLAWNFNRAFSFARGKYSMWIGHDDLMAPEYVARCVKAMEQDADLVLCYAAMDYIDCNGNLIKIVDQSNPAVLDRPSWRFFSVLFQPNCDPIFGLMRTEMLKQTKLHGGFADSDHVLLAEMALRGRFHLLRERLFSKRYHARRTTNLYADLRERTLVFDPVNGGRVFFPLALEAKEFLSAINRAALPVNERLRCYQHLLHWLWVIRRRIGNDIGCGLKSIGRRCLRHETPARPQSLSG